MEHGDLGSPGIPHRTATGLLFAHVGLDENLGSPKNVANSIPTSRVPEAQRVWVFNLVSQTPILSHHLLFPNQSPGKSKS